LGRLRGAQISAAELPGIGLDSNGLDDTISASDLAVGGGDHPWSHA
jgi:hypothetical protein